MLAQELAWALVQVQALLLVYDVMQMGLVQVFCLFLVLFLCFLL